MIITARTGLLFYLRGRGSEFFGEWIAGQNVVSFFNGNDNKDPSERGCARPGEVRPYRRFMTINLGSVISLIA